jgi:hypothetical protein
MPLQIAQERHFFAFDPFTYIIGGLFGDFIQSLSVVCENFYNTGKKGIILISNRGDAFRHGLESTYNDTYKTLMKQKYIHDYKIFSDEKYDVDLVAWRYTDNMYHRNWHHIYSTAYNIDWGKHKWIEVEHDPKWNDKVVINTTGYRWPHLDFNLLYSKYKDDLVFISYNKIEYECFCEKTNLQVEYSNITDFGELCCAISSCKLFVGSLSAPLSIAHSAHVNRVCGLYGGCDDSFNYNLDNVWTNIRYSV